MGLPAITFYVMTASIYDAAPEGTGCPNRIPVNRFARAQESQGHSDSLNRPHRICTAGAPPDELISVARATTLRAIA